MWILYIIYNLRFFCGCIILFFLISKASYLATAAFAREIVALAVFPVKHLMRIRSFIAVADVTFACTVSTTNLCSLVIRFAVGHRDRIASIDLVSLALALLSVKTGITGTHAAHWFAVILTFRSVQSISLFIPVCKTISIVQIWLITSVHIYYIFL